MNCPRCHTRLEDHAHVTDGPDGIVATVPADVARARRCCPCGQFTYQLTSTTSTHTQPALRLIEGAA